MRVKEERGNLWWDGISKQTRKSVKTKERKNFENGKQSEQAEEKCDPKEKGGGAENEAQRESSPPKNARISKAESFLVEGKFRDEEEEKEGRVENRARFQRRGKEES